MVDGTLTSMKKVKTAVIYDKWLSQLGGGEVVACTAAKILKNNGYKITFITGKEVEVENIRKKLNIDLSGVEFQTAWNDEIKIKRISKNKDLFINFSFLDYCRGYAKANLYYTHFPSKPYRTFKDRILNFLILPAIARGLIPQEPIEGEAQISYHHVVYPLNKRAKFSYYYLRIGSTYTLFFKIFLAKFSKSLFEKLSWSIEGAKIKDSSIDVDHRNNLVKVTASVIPTKTTIYLNFKNVSSPMQEDNDAFLIYKPQLYHFFNISGYFDWAQKRVNSRFRAGIFRNALERIYSYQYILANSQFTKAWIKKYWKCEGIVLYPPVDLIFSHKKITSSSKNNWICNVGRFFTRGHGKKQEVLIEAFKKLYDLGYLGWELHLVGGATSDSSTLTFTNQLKKQSAGYPIFFHFNCTRKKVEDILTKSRLYWHATGFGEKEEQAPILFEHFGIAPIEAISARCIPILYNGGGLREIVSLLHLDKQRHLFSSIDQLISNSIYFMEKRNRSIAWKTTYGTLRNQFSKSVFRKLFMQVVTNLE